jgi:hypothetical protein
MAATGLIGKGQPRASHGQQVQLSGNIRCGLSNFDAVCGERAIAIRNFLPASSPALHKYQVTTCRLMHRPITRSRIAWPKRFEVARTLEGCGARRQARGHRAARLFLTLAEKVGGLAMCYYSLNDIR